MKKRVLSVLLVIALLVAVGIVAAQANETDPTPAEIKAEAQTVITAAKAMTFEEGNLPTYCPKCGDNVTWTAITKEYYDSITNHAYQGHYYLAESFEVDIAGLAFNFQGASCLHLNGNGVKNVTTGGWNCVLRGNTELNIFDNAAGTGYIDGGTTQGAIWGGVATTNIYGGTYKGTNSTATIEIRGNNFVNFFDGDLESGDIRFTSVDSSAFQMYGGTLSSTGNIKSNEASTTTEALVGIHGGDVDMTVNTWGKKVVVTGGSIKTLTSAVPTGTSGISISGNPQIETLGLSASYVYPTFGALTEGASIGFGTYTGVISTAYETKAEAEEIAATFPEMQGMSVTVNDAYELVLGARTYTPAEIITESAKQTFGTEETEAFCYHCGEYVTWKPFTDEMAVNTNIIKGHYFLAGDITVTDLASTIMPIDANGDICIHLNNKTWTTTYASANSSYGLIRFRAEANGAIMGKGSITANKAYVFRVNGSTNTKNYHIYSGSFTGNGVTAYSYGMLLEGGTTTLHDGVSYAGGPLYQTAGSTLYIKGGTYTASQLWFAGTTEISGGTFDGYLTARNAAKTTTITGGTFNNYLGAFAGNFDLQGGDFKLWIRVSDSGKISFKGGTYTGSNIHTNNGTTGGTVEIDGATISIPINISNTNANSKNILNIKSGTVSGTITTAVPSSGTSDTQVNISGGNVTKALTMTYGALTVSGGNVSSVTGTTNTTGITVTGGTVTGLTTPVGATVSGGEVGTLEATGGTVAVSNGTVTTLTTSVGANISGGTVNTLTATAGDVVLSGAPTVGLDTELAIDATGLTGGQISGMKEGVFTTAFPTKAAAEAVIPYFVAVDPNVVTATDDFKLTYGARSYTIEEKVALSQAQDFGSEAVTVNKWCYHCGDYKDWTPLSDGGTGTITLATGHYFLANDIKFTGATAAQYGFNIGTESHVVCLHLNGNDITADGLTYTAIRAWSGNLNLMGKGLVQNKADNWAALCVNYGATTNIYGGQFQNIYGKAEQALDFRATTVNIYDATVLDNNVLRVIPNNEGRHPVVTIHNGTYPAVSVTPNAATFDNATLNVKGGAITTLTAGGIVNVEGGTVTTLANSEKSKTITLSGKPTVGAVDLTAGTVKLTVGELVSGASIGLGTTSGVFTTAFGSKAAAEAAKAYFVVGGGMEITVTDAKELSYSAKVYTSAEIVELSAQQTFTGTEPVEAFCYACGSMQTWKPLTGPATVWEGDMYSHKHFFVANDIKEESGDGTFYFASWGNQGTWCLHLNGKTVENTAQQAVIRQHNYRCQVNVLGSGTLINHANVWGTISVAGGVDGDVIGGVNVYGGDLYNDGENSWALTANGGYVNVYGGSIPDDAMNVTAAEVNLYDADYEYINQNGAGTLTIHDGSYTNVRVYNTGEVNINGGNIGTILTNENGGTVKLTGAPTVNGISLAEGKVLDLNGMTGGSLNVGSFEGVFTTAFTGGESAANTVAALVSSPTKAIAVTDLNELTTAAAAAAVVNGDSQKAYATYAQAEQAYTNGYIKLFGNDAINLTKNVTVDFNGHNVDVTGSVELTGFDSTTKDSFANEPGYMTIADTITVKVPEATTENGTVSGYLAVEDDYTTFTYYTMKLSGVALKANPQTVGIYYKGTWNFNDYLPEGKVEAGVVVNVQDQNETPFANGFRSNNANGYYSAPAENIANGEPVTSVLVNDIMKADRNDAALNSQYGQMKIKAAAFVTVNGQDILTDIKNLSVKDILDMFELDENVDKYEAMETKLGKFYQTWVDLANLSSWNLKKIPTIEIAA